MTRLLGVIGDPINHSLSPLIHNAWLRAAGFDATYEAMQVAKGELPAALETLSEGGVMGLNVTLPHKHAALEAATTRSDTAAKIGAANTLTPLPGGGWQADNTDVPGFLYALGQSGFGELAGKRILVFGAGGSARAVVFGLSQGGASLTILNRTEARAAALSTELTQNKARHGPMSAYRDYLPSADLVINTTSMGYSGDVLDLEAGRDRLFVDISYGKIAASQLSHAEAQGWQTMDGLAMLVAQAAESFEIWFNVRPDIDQALQRCRTVVDALA